jgi:signal peptidase II
MLKTQKQGYKVNKFIFFLFIVLCVYIIDRYTKYLSSFVHGCLGICLKQSTNYGAAFNLLQGFEWTRALLIIVGMAVLFFTAFFYFKIDRKITILHLGLAFLFAGTLANMIDRIFYGFVIDFLTMPFNFPSFNIADLSNLVGVILLIVYLIKKK